MPQRLEIPFEAVSVFADPSVEFGLQFTAASAATAAGQVQQRQAGRRTNLAVPSPRVQTNPAKLRADGGSAEVVALDRFRKK